MIYAIVSGFARIFDYSGRSSRSDYWWFQLFQTIVWFALYMFIARNALSSLESAILAMIGLGAALSLLISLSLTVRRFHDQDKSGLNLLWMFAPFIGSPMMIYLMVQPSTPGANRYGPNPHSGGSSFGHGGYDAIAAEVAQAQGHHGKGHQGGYAQQPAYGQRSGYGQQAFANEAHDYGSAAHQPQPNGGVVGRTRTIPQSGRVNQTGGFGRRGSPTFGRR